MDEDFVFEGKNDNTVFKGRKKMNMKQTLDDLLKKAQKISDQRIVGLTRSKLKYNRQDIENTVRKYVNNLVTNNVLGLTNRLISEYSNQIVSNMFGSTVRFNRALKVETRRLEKLFQFLPKDQINGLALENMGLPSLCGELNKVKLIQIYVRTNIKFSFTTPEKKNLRVKWNQTSTMYDERGRHELTFIKSLVGTPPQDLHQEHARQELHAPGETDMAQENVQGIISAPDSSVIRQKDIFEIISAQGTRDDSYIGQENILPETMSDQGTPDDSDIGQDNFLPKTTSTPGTPDDAIGKENVLPETMSAHGTPDDSDIGQKDVSGTMSEQGTPDDSDIGQDNFLPETRSEQGTPDDSDIGQKDVSGTMSEEGTPDDSDIGQDNFLPETMSAHGTPDDSDIGQKDVSGTMSEQGTSNHSYIGQDDVLGTISAQGTPGDSYVAQEDVPGTISSGETPDDDVIMTMSFDEMVACIENDFSRKQQENSEERYTETIAAMEEELDKVTVEEHQSVSNTGSQICVKEMTEGEEHAEALNAEVENTSSGNAEKHDENFESVGSGPGMSKEVTKEKAGEIEEEALGVLDEQAAEIEEGEKNKGIPHRTPDTNNSTGTVSPTQHGVVSRNTSSSQQVGKIRQDDEDKTENTRTETQTVPRYESQVNQEQGPGQEVTGDYSPVLSKRGYTGGTKTMRKQTEESRSSAPADAETDEQVEEVDERVWETEEGEGGEVDAERAVEIEETKEDEYGTPDRHQDSIETVLFTHHGAVLQITYSQQEGQEVGKGMGPDGGRIKTMRMQTQTVPGSNATPASPEDDKIKQSSSLFLYKQGIGKTFKVQTQTVPRPDVSPLSQDQGSSRAMEQNYSRGGNSSAKAFKVQTQTVPRPDVSPLSQDQGSSRAMEQNYSRGGNSSAKAFKVQTQTVPRPDVSPLSQDQGSSRAMKQNYSRGGNSSAKTFRMQIQEVPKSAASFVSQEQDNSQETIQDSSPVSSKGGSYGTAKTFRMQIQKVPRSAASLANPKQGSSREKMQDTSPPSSKMGSYGSANSIRIKTQYFPKSNMPLTPKKREDNDDIKAIRMKQQEVPRSETTPTMLEERAKRMYAGTGRENYGADTPTVKNQEEPKPKKRKPLQEVPRNIDRPDMKKTKKGGAKRRRR